jgi:prevent-host-death family protein
MRTVSAMDMRKRLGEILDAASAGERIVIERDRRPLAYLVSVEDGRRLEAPSPEVLARRLAALRRLDALGERMAREHPDAPATPTAAEEVRRMRDERTDQILRSAGGDPPRSGDLDQR